MVLKVLFAGAVSFVAVNCNSVLPPPDCYATKAPAGVDCLDPELCIKLPPAEGVLVCYHDGIHAPAQGYTRAIYAAEELICRVEAHSDGYCVGDPSEGIEMEARLTPAQQAIKNPKSRAAGGTHANLWPLKDGFYEVPYRIKTPETWTDAQTKALLWALRWLEVNTLIRFVVRTNQKDYISINDSTGGCSSYIGCLGGVQSVKLTANCKISGVITHELMHALGAEHEHQRSDRDDYIDVFDENVKSPNNFEKETGSKNVAPYDYVSLMHYSSRSSSKNGEPSMLPKDRSKKHLIDSYLMSPSVCDYYSINKFYGGYNIPANDKCKPNVYVDVCKPTEKCYRDKDNCPKECNEWCEQGLLNEWCERRWSIDTLTKYVTKYSGSGVPFDFPTYDPYPDEDPTGAGSVSGGSGGDGSGGDASGGSGGDASGDSETAGGTTAETGGAAGGVLSTRCAVAAMAVTLIAAALFD